jgi:tetratricopeptide (TPR) repeat protein
MKKILNLIALVLFASVTAYAESAVKQLEKFVETQDYPEAARFIQSAIAESPKDEDVYVICGDVYSELLNADSAMTMYKKAYDLDKSNKKIIIKLSGAYSEVKMHKESIELMRKAEKDNKNDLDVQLALAQSLIKGDSTKVADLIIRKALKTNDKNPKVYLALADLYFKDQIYLTAIDNYNEVIKLDPKQAAARINLATAYYQIARQEEDKDLKNSYYTMSLNQWEYVANQDPKNAKAFWEAGKIYYYSEVWDNAAIYLNKYIQLRPAHSLARFYLVEALYKINKCEELQQNADIVIKEIDSVKIRVKTWQCECFFKTQKYKEAIAQFKDLSSLVKLNGEQLEQISLSYLFSGDTVTAINSYKDVIKVDPKRASSLTSFGSLAMNRKDYENAALFFQVRDENIDDANTSKMRYFLGLSYLFGEKPLEASKTFEKVISQDPNNFSAMVYLGDAYSKMGAKDSSKTILLKAIELMTPKATENEATLNNAYQKVCSSLLNEKNYKELNSIAKAWTEALPNSQYAFFFFGVSYHGQGDGDNACKYYKKAFAIDPKSDFAIKNIKKQMDGVCNPK